MQAVEIQAETAVAEHQGEARVAAAGFRREAEVATTLRAALEEENLNNKRCRVELGEYQRQYQHLHAIALEIGEEKDEDMQEFEEFIVSEGERIKSWTASCQQVVSEHEAAAEAWRVRANGDVCLLTSAIRELQDELGGGGAGRRELGRSSGEC